MKTRYWIILIGAALFAAIIIIIPLGIERYAETWLRDQGVADASIGNVDFNPFTGTLLIDAITFAGTAEQRGHIDTVTLNAQWTELVKQRVLLANVTIAGMQLDVRQLDDGRYRLGGLVIPTESAATQPAIAETEPTDPAWGFGLDNLAIDNLELTYQDARLDSRLKINQATLDRLATWEPERRSEIAARLSLDGAAITFRSAVAPLAPELSATSKLTVKELKLLPYAAVFDQLGLADISGAVSIDVTSNLRYRAPGTVALDLSGSAMLTDLAATLPLARVTNQRLSWSGELAATLPEPGTAPQVSGTMNLAVSAFSITHPDKPLGLLAFDELAIKDIEIKSLDLVKIGGISIQDLTVLSSADATTLSIATTQLDAIHIAERAKVSIDRVAIDGLLGLIERKASGKLEPTTTILAEFAPPSPEPGADGEQAAAAVTGTPESAFTFNLGVLEIGGASRVRAIDHMVSPPLTTTLQINTLRVTGVRNDDPAQPMHVKFDFQQDDGATLAGEGDLWLFGEQPATDLQLTINRLGLPQVSSYVPGYHIERGVLSVESRATLKDDQLAVTNVLVIEKLKLAGKAAGEQQVLGEGMAMPLDVALDLLRDSKDRIKLELPVSGSLSDPKFGTGDLVRLAMQGAMQKAAMSYVKNALQPLGTIMLVTKIAGKAARPRFEPVTFAPGEAQLTTDGRAYLDKIAKLLTDRSGLSITFCGVSTQADHDFLVAKMPPLPPQVTPATEASPEVTPDFAAERLDLAAARGNAMQQYLATSGGINAERLYRCRPVLEASDEEPPRVEISL